MQRVPQPAPLPVLVELRAQPVLPVRAVQVGVQHKVARPLKGGQPHRVAPTRAEVRTPVAALQRRGVVKAQQPRRVAHKRHRRRAALDRRHQPKVVVRVLNKAVAMVPRLMAPVAAQRPTRLRVTMRSLRLEHRRISIVPLRSINARLF